jgi:membrane-associated phospholipid phosphatase
MKKNNLENHKIKKFIAALISTFFSPLLIFAATIIILSITKTTNITQAWIPALVALFFLVGIPGITILILFKKRLVHDIHLHHRKDRQIPLLITVISALAGLIILTSQNAPQYLLVITATVFLNTLILWIVTFYWKISIHAATLAVAITIFAFVYNPIVLILYFLLIFVGWSRVYRKRHTWKQVVVGAILAILVTIAVFNMYGYGVWGLQ